MLGFLEPVVNGSLDAVLARSRRAHTHPLNEGRYPHASLVNGHGVLVPGACVEGPNYAWSAW